MNNFKKNEYVVLELSRKILSDAKNHYEIHKNFSNEILLILHSIYNEVLENAFEILDKGKIIEHRSEGERHFYVVTLTDEHLTLYDEVNFCFCEEFRDRVLGEQRHALTCRHNLALEFAKMTGKVKLRGDLKEEVFVDRINNLFKVST